ncbi:MAG: lectin like domain-containing protein [Methanomicrobiales archaeon]|nr:lectin like domain-containing protein [Methanomicrobiales archaeon]
MFRKTIVVLLLAALLLASVAPVAAVATTATVASDAGATDASATVQAGASPRENGLKRLAVASESSEYQRYREEKQRGQVRTTTAGGRSLGYIPSPVSLSHLTGAQVPRRALVAASQGMAAEGGIEESIPGGDVVSLPASYDLRTLGKLTPVKNQGACGSCWAFATYGSLESTLLTAETWDFSENNLKNRHGYVGTHCAGGNAYMSTAYLARYAGPVSEADDPYNAVSSYSPSGLTARKHVQDVLYLPDRSGPLDNDNIKNAIQVYGGIYSLIYWTDAAYQTATSSFYYSGEENINHAITIVGWDDTYDRSRFRTSAPGNGAFIVRNSWSTSFGDGGYFYVSYYDAEIGHGNVVFTGESTQNFQNIYQYDTLGWLSSAGFGGDTGYFANVFTASGAEQITGASFYTASPHSEYQVSVYTNPSGGPLSAPGPLSTKTGTIAIPGYHTVLLETPVAVTAGQKFSVVVRLRTPGFNYPIPLESPVTGYATNVNAAAGQSYISQNGVSWSDTTASWKTTNVCLKAFAGSGGSPSPAPVLSSISPSTATAGGSAFTLTASGSSFVPGSVIRWNGVDRTTTYVSATQLSAAIPAADIATAGSAAVTVYTPAPGGGTSSPQTFTVTPAASPLPVLSSISPSTATAGGAAFTLTVTGSSFTSQSKVRWNGADRTTTYVSATQLTTAIPAADIATAGTASVTVYTPAPGGGTSSAREFTISSAPFGGLIVTTETATTYTYLSYSKTYLRQAQSLKAAGTGISQVAVALAKKGSPSQAITLSIRTTPNGANLATATISPALVTSTDYLNPTWVTVPVTAGGLNPGNTLYVVLSTSSGDYRNYYRVPLNSRNPFADGIHFRGTTGSSNPAYDMLVKVWFTG